MTVTTDMIIYTIIILTVADVTLIDPLKESFIHNVHQTKLQNLILKVAMMPIA